LDEPVDLTKAVELEKNVRVWVSDCYFLSLVFDRRNQTTEHIFSVVGLPPQLGDAGVPVQVRWRLVDVRTNDSPANGDRETIGSNASSRRELERLLEQFDLASGKYRFSLTVPNAAPAFAGINTRVVLTLHPKLTHSPTAGWVFLCSFLSRLVVLPCAIIVAGILVFRAL
jgi:hypothetical protein